MLRCGSLTRFLLAAALVVALPADLFRPAALSSEDPAPKAVKPNVSAEARIERALEQNAEFEFRDTPLSEVAKFIAGRYEGILRWQAPARPRVTSPGNAGCRGHNQTQGQNVNEKEKVS